MEIGKLARQQDRTRIYCLVYGEGVLSSESSTVADLKQSLYNKKYGFLPDDQIIIHCGRKLSDDRLLINYEIPI
jgi:hypothetical protein